jgi:hypothetical protein
LKGELIKSPKTGNRLILTHQCNIRFVLRDQLRQVCNKDGLLGPGNLAVISKKAKVLGCLDVKDLYALAALENPQRPPAFSKYRTDFSKRRQADP